MLQFNFHDGPIIACSSGATQNAAISIIRLSGFSNLEVFRSLFSIDLQNIQPRHVYLTNLTFEKIVIDSILFTYFSAPASYNGENILELSVHGNILNIQRIIKIFVDNYEFREAFPGEFTYRALKNKKISLTQVEGLDLLLNSTSKDAYDQGLSLLNGELSNSYEMLFEKYLNLKSSIELFFDFLDDVGEDNAKENFEKSRSEFTNLIISLHKRSSAYSSNLLIPEIVLIGPTNAGKSSLFNSLLGHDRAIVSPIAGTTRDTISEYLNISGIQFKFVDTAGLREGSQDSIENEGIRRTLKIYENSFFKILVLNPFFELPDNIKEFSPDVIIFTHDDVSGFNDQLTKIIPLLGPGPTLASSCLNRGSIEPQLFPLIVCKFNTLNNLNPLYIERHRITINAIYLQLCNFNELFLVESDFAIISSELNSIGQNISELIGIVSPDLVLNNIFSNFCIGK